MLTIFWQWYRGGISSIPDIVRKSCFLIQNHVWFCKISCSVCKSWLPHEKLSSLKNYDIVFFIGNDENVSRHEEKLKNINPNIDIFDAKYEPKNLEDFDKNKNYFAFSGIGNHETFLDTLKLAKLNIIENKEFPDHFDYSSSNIKSLVEYADNKKLDLVTTKKDFLKIDKLFLNKIKYLDIDLVIKDEMKLLKKIIWRV